VTLVPSPHDLQFFEMLSESYFRLLGRPLPTAGRTGHAASRWLYEDAPFCLLAHDTSADPAFCYANRTAQRRFEYTWDEFVGMPSRLSAEEPNRDERHAFMQRVRRYGFSEDYSGVRVAKSGRRFRIEQAVVWNVLGRDSNIHGQAAMFGRWTDL
jgi:hypothetical protein